MSDKKLKPRVGDRVIVRSQHMKPQGLRTFVGIVRGEHKGGRYLSVEVDGQPNNWWVPADELTVVDRVPVEWPEGWDRHSNYEAGLYLEDNGWYFQRSELEFILRTGPDMLARWDELMGGDE